MLKLFWADIRQLKNTFIFLVLTIPFLHYLDSALFSYALPTTVNIKVEDMVFKVSEPFAASAGWIFAIMASVILMLFSEESGGSLQSRLSSLVILPLSRWRIGLLRHLPALTIVPLLGLLLNVYRGALAFFYAMTRTDLWQLHGSMDFQTTWNCLVWAFDKVAYIEGAGYASILFQMAGWASMSLLILGIPLLIDDIWPNIKRSSFSLWLSVSVFIGIILQVALLALGKHFNLELFPHINSPDVIVTGNHSWLPSLMGFEILLALGVMSLELWWFQRRPAYV